MTRTERARLTLRAPAPRRMHQDATGDRTFYGACTGGSSERRWPSRRGAVCGTALSVMPRVAARWRCSARYTVERPTPNRSASSAVLCSPDSRRATRCASCRGLSLGYLPRSRPFAFATFIPSRVRNRIRTDSATMASTLNSNRPTASSGSYTELPEAEPDLPGGQLIGDRPRRVASWPAGRVW